MGSLDRSRPNSSSRSEQTRSKYLRDYINEFDPGKYIEDGIPAYNYTNPIPDFPSGEIILAVLSMIDEHEDLDFGHKTDDPITYDGNNPLPLPLGDPELPPLDGDDYDYDSDGINNQAEINVYGTDPEDVDSDDDHYFLFTYGTDDEYTFNDGDERDFWDFELPSHGGAQGNFDGDQNGLNNLLDPDSDNDGMWDGWELCYGFMPYDDGSINYSIGGTPNPDEGPAGDYDEDGLSNLDEFSNPSDTDVDSDRTTNPLKKDTDGDGLKDGEEVHIYHTDPTDPDTDNDGLWDGWHDDNDNQQWDANEEKGELGDLTTGLGGYGTFPTVWDTDGDGVNDGDEIEYIGDIDWDQDGDNSQIDSDSDDDDIIDGNEKYKWDSDGDSYCNANDKDADGDGLLDGIEDENKNGICDTGETDPAYRDTDYDGLWDGNTVGNNEGEADYGTDPTDSDSDNDNFWDGYELDYWGHSGWNKNWDYDNRWNNLLDPDADADGLKDGDEYYWYDTILEDFDSDKDGLWDGWQDDNDNLIYDSWEIKGEYNYGTKATDPDTDNDELNEGDEVNYWENNVFYDKDGARAHWDSDHDEDGRKNIKDWDSDGDLIKDGGIDKDNEPAKYNDMDGNIFDYDAITVNNNLGVTVVIDYSGGSTIKPIIDPYIPQTTLNAGIPKYFDISTTSPQTFTAIIKVIYSTPLPQGVDESHVRMYKWDECESKWRIEFDTGVDMNKDYFWSKVTEFSTRQGGDAEEEHSDNDWIDDWHEINGHTTNGYYYNGNIYGNNFIFKTDPNEEDTDNDGLNDNLDSIPLDYDMDGDDLLNAPYSEMLYDAGDIYLGGGIDINSDDIDMDNDGTNDELDLDDDNDGMSDAYEVDYGVSNNGWQNPYKHNERYALVVGGGDIDSNKNHPAFWKDTKEIYNVLENQYNYEPEHIYLHFWNHQQGVKEGIYIDGPADWNIEDEADRLIWGNGIKQNLEILETKMTKNDFIFVFMTSHGGKEKKKGIGEGWIQIYDIENQDRSCLYYHNDPYLPNSLGHSLENLIYARMVLVFSACASGTAIKGTDDNPEWNLKSQYRIIMTSSDKNEESHFWAGDEWTSDDNYDHYEFLWNEDGHGFVRELKDSGTISLKSAYDSGYTAARDDDWEIEGSDNSYAQIYEWSSDIASDTYL
jgi:hypothetical protein